MNRDDKCKELRLDIMKMLNEAQSGHPGGSLSCVEILYSLYFNVMNIDPKNPQMEDRDRFIMSKGHAAPALYAMLANLGYFPKSDLKNLRQINSHLQGHPDMNETPGVDMSTGSLGQGAASSVGYALAAKLKQKDYMIYVLIGDGECQEGLIWEAAMAAANFGLDNLVFLLDYNGLQIDGSNEEVMDIGDIVAKFKAFGFDTKEVDGHNIDEITSSLKNLSKNKKPKFICCKTIKGKGVSYMENDFTWHGSVPNEELYELAINELEGK